MPLITSKLRYANKLTGEEKSDGSQKVQGLGRTRRGRCRLRCAEVFSSRETSRPPGSYRVQGSAPELCEEGSEIY